MPSVTTMRTRGEAGRVPRSGSDERECDDLSDEQTEEMMPMSSSGAKTKAAMGDPRPSVCVPYQARQAFSRTIGCPALQPKAAANSGMLLTVPMTRNSPGECGST